jgi:hypothetical protein
MFPSEVGQVYFPVLVGQSIFPSAEVGQVYFGGSLGKSIFC